MTPDEGNLSSGHVARQGFPINDLGATFHGERVGVRVLVGGPTSGPGLKSSRSSASYSPFEKPGQTVGSTTWVLSD